MHRIPGVLFALLSSLTLPRRTLTRDRGSEKIKRKPKEKGSKKREDSFWSVNGFQDFLAVFFSGKSEKREFENTEKHGNSYRKHYRNAGACSANVAGKSLLRKISTENLRIVKFFYLSNPRKSCIPKKEKRLKVAHKS